MAVSKYGMISRLVWDGGNEVRIPEELGKPAPNQMQGTAAERVSELSGRCCYDSLGRGRSSEDYHKHILDVAHGSVYEHFAMTVQLGNCDSAALWTLINRPGIWVEADYGKIRVTFNPRAILDWNFWTKQLTYLADAPDLVGKTGSIGDRLAVFAERSFPQIVPLRDRALWACSNYDGRVVEPRSEQEKWISMFMCGSRGWSHEQVRHKFRTAVSQRSTRFVNEAESPWLDHPLVQEYLEDKAQPVDHLAQMEAIISSVKKHSKETYSFVVQRLEPWLIGRGVEKLTARKQARGAARGYLGNALWTEMIFSASVAEWKWMMKLRCSSHADAEIRGIFCEALPELRSSRYGDDFKNLELVPAPDGLGQMAVETSSVHG